MNRWLIAGVACAQLLVSRGASAAPNDRTAWETFVIPGTLKGICSVLEFRNDRLTPERFTPELIRATYRIPPRQLAALGYFETLEAFREVYAALGGPLTLDLAERSDSRRRLRAVLDFLGLELREPRRGPRSVRVLNEEADERVRTALGVAGVPIADIDTRLNAGETVALTLPSFTVPLPLGAAWWESAFGTVPDILKILREPRTSLLFYGMSTLDRDTLEYFKTRPKVARAVFASRAAAFAAFGGALRVRDGKVAVPGGTAAVPFWESLVREEANDPEYFMELVLQEEAGRLAYLYSVVGALDAPHQRFALGTWKPSYRADREAAGLLRGFRILQRWNLERRPFSRPDWDPAMLFALVEVDETGRFKGPASQSLWSAVFRSFDLPQRPDRELDAQSDLVDLPFLLELIFPPATELLEAKRRLFTLTFAQRVFASAPEASAPAMLIALRGFQRFPALHLTLERMGITDPVVHEAAARSAAALQDYKDPDRGAQAISQFQGALALIDRATRSRKLTPAQSARLVGSLAALPRDNDGRYQTLMTTWLERELMPAVIAAPAAGTTTEQAFLAGLAGLSTPVEPDDEAIEGPLVEWEGLHYRVNPSPNLFRRFKVVRSVQSVNSLDAVLELLAFRNALASTRLTFEQIPTLAATSKTLRDRLREPVLPLALTDREPLSIADALNEVDRRLSRIRNPRQVRDATRVLEDLDELIERLTADLLRSLAYAVAIPDEESTLLTGGDVSHSHDLGLGELSAPEREAIAWGLPDSQIGSAVQSRVRGALLGLDVALAELALRRVIGLQAPIGAPAWNVEGRKALMQYLAFFDPFDAQGPTLASLTSTIASGRARVRALAQRPEDLESVIEVAALSPLRRAMLEWTLAHDAERVSTLFSLGELLRLGAAPGDPAGAPRWGAPVFELTGCLCLRASPHVDFEFFAGRDIAVPLATYTSDSLLRLAQVFGRYELPVAVIGDILPNLVQTLIDGAPLNHRDDWLTFAGYVAGLPERAIEDFVSTVTTGRSLLPAVADLP